MIGDSYTGRYPEDERFPVHYDIFPDDECFGELEEKVEQPEGFPPKVFYVCSECGQEIEGSVVLNRDRDTTDWEYDYEPYY